MHACWFPTRHVFQLHEDVNDRHVPIYRTVHGSGEPRHSVQEYGHVVTDLAVPANLYRPFQATNPKA